MSASEDLRRIALSFEGTTEAPHFDRTAFRARRIYVTVAADGNTANFMFTPDQQEFKCLTAPDAFAPVPNAWGKRGATTAILAKLTNAELEGALRLAWHRAVVSKPQDGRVQNARDRRDRAHGAERKPRRSPRRQQSSLFRLAEVAPHLRLGPSAWHKAAEPLHPAPNGSLSTGVRSAECLGDDRNGMSGELCAALAAFPPGTSIGRGARRLTAQSLDLRHRCRTRPLLGEPLR